MAESNNSQAATTDNAPAGDDQGKNRGEGPKGRRASQLDMVAAVLRGEEPTGDDDQGDDQGGGEGQRKGVAKGDDDGQRGEPGEGRKKGTPKTFDELAEALGVKVEALYGITFKVADGDSAKEHTLGELKDVLKEREQFTVDRLAFDEERTAKEAEFMRARAELQELVGLLPREAVKPELLKKIRERRDTLVAREREKTLEVIPEWKNDDRKAQEVAEISKHLGAYGFPANFLESITDHRTLKYIRDNWLRQQRIERALAQVKKVSATTHTASGKQNGAAGKQQPAPRTGRRVDSQALQVADVLKSSLSDQ